uniref:Uncharacterized protein n=1 Tax=Xiphophorus couchianus TaxID=32473 RepID=A0A3B5MQ58_9TELE
MSDSSNSTGSTGSSTNSWTLLSPEEAAIENVGPADDGTESLGDAPSLSEEVAGAAAEEKPAELPVETVLSEEGHQVGTDSLSGSLAQRLCCCRLLFSSSVFLFFFIFSDPSNSMEMGEVNGFDDGLRRRNVPSFEAPRPRTSDEEDDEEEVEFKMAEKKEDKPWFSMSKCIVAALVLLFLGSLFLSGEYLALYLLLKLWDFICNLSRFCLLPQLRKEQLDSEIQALAESDNDQDKAGLDERKLKLKEELATLPKLSTELESLRARVNEYNQFAATGPERKQDETLEEELHCQKDLLDDIKKRLGGMQKDKGDGKQVWENLDGIQKQLSKEVESWEKEWKHSKEEKKEKENSHKESWRKHQDEWQRRKSERRMDRDERRKEKPWHSRPGKNSHQPRQPHHHQHHHNDFWRDQELKLHRNVRPQLGCSSLEDCASREGLYPVELAEFEELLEGYLSKLEGSSNESKDKLRKVTADFFEDGVFIHDRVRFGDFAEDVADVLEDMVDVMEGSHSLEEEMEEFEREALWKFAATA